MQKFWQMSNLSLGKCSRIRRTFYAQRWENVISTRKFLIVSCLSIFVCINARKVSFESWKLNFYWYEKLNILYMNSIPVILPDLWVKSSLIYINIFCVGTKMWKCEGQEPRDLNFHFSEKRRLNYILRNGKVAENFGCMLNHFTFRQMFRVEKPYYVYTDVCQGNVIFNDKILNLQSWWTSWLINRNPFRKQ
jgi:hypothetical protein